MNNRQDQKAREAIKKAIKTIGTQKEVADMMNLSQSTLSHWVCGGYKIGAASAMQLARFTRHKFKAHQFRPDIFSDIF